MRRWLFGRRIGRCTRWEQVCRIPYALHYAAIEAMRAANWVYKGQCAGFICVNGFLPALKSLDNGQFVLGSKPCPRCSPDGKMTVESLLGR